MNARTTNGSQSRNGSLRDLAALGQLRGALTVDDIRKSLPIDRMSDEDVAATMAYLEEKGIEVLVDPKLLVGSPRPSPEARRHQPTVGLTKTDPPRTDGTNWLASRPPEQPAWHGSSGHSSLPTAAVVLAGAVVCMLFAILLWVLR
jgi:hypothetical protein